MTIDLQQLMRVAGSCLLRNVFHVIIFPCKGIVVQVCIQT